MTKILYLGNQLSHKGLNKTTIDTLSELLVQEGFELKTASSISNPFFRLLDMLLAVIKHRYIDYVLIDTYSTTAFWYAFLVSQLARSLKIKYIPILHGGNLPYRIKKNPKLARLLFDNAYVNIAPSNYLKQEFEKQGFQNLQYIPNTIEIANYAFRERNNLQPKLLWVRAFASIYNPKMTIDVLKGLQKKYPNAELCMVGPDKDGTLAQTKDYANQLGVTVTFTGGLSKDEWIRLSENYDCFLNTTNFDNTPVSVIEAMALGLPVISTQVGGIPFLLEHQKNAFLVDANDASAMITAIEDLLQNPELSREITFQARKKVESFDWQHLKHTWSTLLR